MSITALAILSAFFSGISNVWTRSLLRGINSLDLLKISFLTHGLLLLIVSPFFYYLHLSWQTGGLILMVAVIDWLANYFYFKTFEKAEASIATPLLSLSPSFTFLFGWLFIGDIVNLRTYIISFAIIILIAFFSINFKDFKRFNKETLIPGLLSSFLFGVSAIPSKLLLDSMHAINAPTLFMVRAFLISLFAFLFFSRRSFGFITKRQCVQILGRSVMIIASWILLYTALAKGNAGVAITLGSITPIFVFILSIVFLSERPTLRKVIAAVLVLGLSLTI